MDSDALRALVECHRCLEVRKDTRYFQCANNHSMCEVCMESKTIDVCPLGQCSYSNPPMRDRKVEQLIENSYLELSCKYSRLGCPLTCKLFQLYNHETECPHRITRCKLNICNEEMRHKDMAEHISRHHIECGNPGCKFTSTAAGLKEHSTECPRKEVKCPGKECEEDKIPIADLLRHLRTHHDEMDEG